jgi:F-type H+-transporting ATPase subunit b
MRESFFADPRTWVAIAFVIFFVLFGRKIWSVLTGMLDKRAEQIRAELAEARRLRGEAEAMLADARSRRETAMEDAKRLLESARNQAAQVSRAAAADAEQTARRREQMAMDRIAAAEKEAVDQVRFTAAEIAGAAAAQVLREGLTPEADAHLVDQAIQTLPTTLVPRRAA